MSKRVFHWLAVLSLMSFSLTAAQAATPFTGCTTTQGGWSGTIGAGALLSAQFPTVYPSGLLIGTAANFHLLFTTADKVKGFLPQMGPPSSLNGSATNPTSSSAGVFGGQILTLQLNVDLNGLGVAVLKNTGTSLDGKTVAQILGIANTALGTGALPSGFLSISALDDLIDSLNSAFSTCAPSTFAQNSLTTSSTLSITKSHTGTFTQGGTGEWDLTVSNGAGQATTNGTTTVADTLPSGYTVKNFSTTDSSWNCGGAGTATATCTSTSGVAGGSSFPAIKIIVNIPANSPLSVTNTAKAYGGGDAVHTSLATAVSGGDTVMVACPAVHLTSLSASPNVLWPPNGKLVPVSLSETTSGGCANVTASCQIQSVSSSEPPDGVDWVITGNLTLDLRAQRLGTRKGNTNGRVYTITLQCTDGMSNASKTTTVIVPHDQGK